MNLVLYITNECNLNCLYCFVNKNKEVMQMNTYKNIFEEYKEKIDTITFFGGEPLLQIELINQIIEYNKINQYKYNYIINTNGIKINNKLINLCKQNNILLNISLDGNGESNNRNRFGENFFNLIENNIKLIKTEGIKFIINYVITPNNIEHISESLKYFVENGFMDICLMIDYHALWTKQNIKEMKNQLEKSIPSMLKIIDRDFIRIYPIYNKINYIIEGKKRKKCDFGKDSVVVSCDGKKYPCIAFVNDNHYEIIEDNKTFINICNVEKCKDCEYVDVCNNNCMCRFYRKNKESEVDINCECEKIFIEIAKKIVSKILNHELNEEV